MKIFPAILKEYKKYNFKQGLQIYFDMNSSGGSSSKREQASK